MKSNEDSRLEHGSSSNVLIRNYQATVNGTLVEHEKFTNIQRRERERERGLFVN